ncbi:hypothetical protein PGQ11_012627 [Apiospora arundinis]|uniref:Uncharacterized protein n=1 Tax=Apiospora arundinis TaxID=335852 RepID=A0ABR2I4S9_9PEZI
MGDVIAGISLAQQLLPLIGLAFEKLRLLSSSKKRHAMLEEFRELGYMYKEVRHRVQNLERNVRREFLKMIRTGRDALQWLAALVEEPSSRQSKWCRFRRRIQRAIFYLVGESTLKFARRQIRSILKHLQIYEQKKQQRKTSYVMDKIFMKLESMEREFTRYCNLADSTQEIDDVLEILKTERAQGHTNTANHPDFVSSTIDGHNPTAHHELEDECHAMTDNEGEYLKSGFSPDDNSDIASLSSGEVDARSDARGDSFLPEGPPHDEETEPDGETYEESIASEKDDYEAESTTNDEMGRDSISESLPEGDNTQPGTDSPLNSSTETNAEPEPPVCPHENIKTHSWSWSVVAVHGTGSNPNRVTGLGESLEFLEKYTQKA